MKFPYKYPGWSFWERVLLKAILPILLPFFFAGTASATQAHGGTEGILTHQVGHMFFMLSMVTFAFWLRGRGLVKNKGWRDIYYGALFFALWNLDVICVHLLDEQLFLVDVNKVEGLLFRVDSEIPFFRWFYFLAKHDHLLCVPALIFLYTGLKKLFDASAGSVEVHR